VLEEPMVVPSRRCRLASQKVRNFCAPPPSPPSPEEVDDRGPALGALPPLDRCEAKGDGLNAAEPVGVPMGIPKGVPCACASRWRRISDTAPIKLPPSEGRHEPAVLEALGVAAVAGVAGWAAGADTRRRLCALQVVSTSPPRPAAPAVLDAEGANVDGLAQGVSRSSSSMS